MGFPGVGGFNPVTAVGGYAAEKYLSDGGSSAAPHRTRFKDKSPQEIIDAIHMAEATGMGDSAYLKKLLAKRGLTWEGANPEDIKASFDVNDPTSTDFNNVQDLLRKSTKGGEARKSVQLENFDKFKSDLIDKKMKEYFGENVQPTYDRVNQQITDLLSKPAFSPEELAGVRSELTSQARAQESQRLRRVAATLGLRGMDPGSIAGAALVQKQAEETDAALTDALRRFGLDVTEQERQSQAQELGLSTNLANTMFAAKNALETSNWDRIHGINQDIGAILEAANTLDATTKASLEAARKQANASMIAGGAQAVGSIVGGALGA